MPAIVRSPLTAARATFALKAGEWFRRGRLLMLSPGHGDYRRCQAEIPLIVLFRFPGPALPADTPRYSLPPSETQTPADPARNVSDAPRYTARPAPVDNAPPTTGSTAPSTVTPSTAQPERRYDDRGYYDDAGYHPFPRRHTDADHYAERPHGYTDRPYHRARWNARRIIAELHRYGIYW